MSRKKDKKTGIRYSEKFIEHLTEKIDGLDLPKSLANCDDDMLPVHGLTLQRILDHKQLDYLASDAIIVNLLKWLKMVQCTVSYKTSSGATVTKIIIKE